MPLHTSTGLHVFFQQSVISSAKADSNGSFNGDGYTR